MENPFENPNKVDKVKNEEIMNIIRVMFQENGKLEFHDMIKYFEQSIKDRDIQKAKISAYYCANVIISQQTLKDTQKLQLILGMREELDKLQDDLDL